MVEAARLTRRGFTFARRPGSKKLQRTSGNSAFTARSTVVICRSSTAASRSSRIRACTDSITLSPSAQADDADHVGDFRALAQEVAQGLLAFRVHALPDQQRLDLDRDEHRHHHQQRADGERADRVPRRVAGRDREQHRGQREHQAEQRGRVPRRRSPPVPPGGWRGTTATANAAARARFRRQARMDTPSATMANTSTPAAHHHCRSGSGCASLCQPSYSEYRPPTVNSISATRNDQSRSPCPAPAGVPGDGARRLAHAQQQQQLVAAVGHQMHGLGQHRAGPVVKAATPLAQAMAKLAPARTRSRGWNRRCRPWSGGRRGRGGSSRRRRRRAGFRQKL